MGTVGAHLEGAPALGLRSEALHHGDERLRLVQARKRLQGEKVNPLPHQHLDARQMNLLETGVLGDVDVVGTGVLTAISQKGPIRPEPSGYEHRLLGVLLAELTGRLLGQTSAGCDDLPGASSILPGPDQRRKCGLVGVGRDDAGSGVQIVGVNLAHDVGRRGERKRRPQRVAGVDSTGVELGPHRPVQNDRAARQQIRQPDRFTPEGCGGYRERSHCDTVSDGSRRHR